MSKKQASAKRYKVIRAIFYMQENKRYEPGEEIEFDPSYPEEMVERLVNNGVIEPAKPAGQKDEEQPGEITPE